MANFPAEIEGIIETIDPVPADPNAVVLKVNGVFVDFKVSPTSSLRTPQGPISIEQLTRAASLPGRDPIKGFIGATAIVEGEVDSVTNRIAASKIEVEPGETLILGIVSQIIPGPPASVAVNGVPIDFLTDDRLKASAPRNEFGFDIKLESVLRDMPASVSGYYAAGKFQAYLFEVDGPATLTTTAPQVSILRAQSRARGAENDVDVRGAITTENIAVGTQQRVDIFRVDIVNGQPEETRLGGTQARVIAGGFTKWRFDERITAGPGILAEPPKLVRAYNVSLTTPPVSADFEVEVRED